MKHQPQFVAADTGTQAAKIVDHADYLLLVQLALHVILHGVEVVSPAALPEQLANVFHALAWMALAKAYG